jgi:uncharacterized protein
MNASIAAGSAVLKNRYSFSILLLCTFLLLVTSCATRSSLRVDKLAETTINGDFLPAIQQIKKNPKLYGKTNRFLYYMDIGVLFHYAGKYDSSNTYLLQALDIIDELYARSVTNEAAAIMVNDNIRPYRSKPYELTMVHQLIALNFLALGNVESALVETRRANLMFQELQRKNKSGGKYESDGMFQYVSSIAYDQAGETSDAMISLFHAVKTFEEGPVALPSKIQDKAYYLFQLNDRQDDIKLLDLSAPTEKPDGIENRSEEIVFIGYAGRGPVIEEQAWWGTWIKDGLLILHYDGPNGERETMQLPAPRLPPSELKKAEKGKKTKSGTTFHIKVALPAEKTIPSKTGKFNIHLNGNKTAYSSITINDFNKQTKKYLEDTKTTTIARTVARVVLRTITSQKTKEKLQTSSPVANLLGSIATDILADQLEKADTRSCFLLPQTVQIARIPVNPGVYSIDIAALSKGGKVLGTKKINDIIVHEHEKKFVFYSSFK